MDELPAARPALFALPSSPHALSAADVAHALGLDVAQGLDDEEADRRRVTFGYNELRDAPAPPRWRLFLRQFRELVVGILLLAAIISLAMREWADSIIILAIVLLNALIGFFQEERAGAALAALRRLSSPHAKVLRGGALRSAPARELVPGDRIDLEAGDSIPADVRLLESTGFRVQESSLTGESAPVDKDARGALPEATPLADRRDMAYLGTTAAAGRASAVVCATGAQTELGRIAGMLQRYEPEVTPLQRRLSELGRVLIGVILALVVVIGVVHLWQGRPWLQVLLLAVSLAVAAVPEGMPAVVTIALALGMQRMARRNALIRKLPSVETLGSVTVICSDKTGTLTRNEMTVQQVIAGGARYAVTGAGYAPQGQFLQDLSSPKPVAPAPGSDLYQALLIGVRCNHARLRSRGNGGAQAWEIVGDPTEAALVVAAAKAGIEPDAIGHGPVAELPFDSDRKMMSVVVKQSFQSGNGAVTYTKGALEAVLGCCIAELHDGQVRALTEDRRRQIRELASEMAARAMRVLGLAYRKDTGVASSDVREADLVFAGMTGMVDPPRAEAKAAVAQCHDAGIRPVMITGDHPLTALAIARELGIARPDDVALSGQELDAMSDEALAGRVKSAAVYARVTAEHKLRVVRALKAGGDVVAMTGDGVNDAPAIKAADIGIAMGIAGTDVTKEASDMVLMDDNFASIVMAIEEGRGIFDNIQKFVHYLLSCNGAEVLFMFCAAIVGWPLPLSAAQILWINLVTDGLPALALGVEPTEPNAMRRPPRPAREPLLTRKRGFRILLHACLIAAATAIGFGIVYDRNDPASLPRARTVAFCVLAFAELLYAFACRSPRYTMPELGAKTNPTLLAAIAGSAALQSIVILVPFLRRPFDVVPGLGSTWVLVAALALAPVTVIEVTKLLTSRRRR